MPKGSYYFVQKKINKHLILIRLYCWINRENQRAIDNPEILATLGTQKTQDEDIQNKNKTQKLKT
jgi:hypothetical protein